MGTNRRFAMNRKLSLLVVVCIGSIVLSLSLSQAAQTLAQGPQPPNRRPLKPAETLSSTFTYQGQLRRANAPANAACDFQFGLWDSQGGGNQLGATVAQTIGVTNGQFTTQLNFGNQFTGDARWLEVAVQCPGDGGPTTLTPRQALSATPYALSLQPGAVISGPIFFGADLWLQNNDQLGYGLISQGGYIGAYVTSISGTGVYGVSSAGTGVVGSSNSTFGVYGSTYTGTAGVYGVTARPNGSGVEGHANGDRAAGTYGVNQNGPGVWGTSTNGMGVYGETSAAHTITYSAVYGRSYGNGGIGVIGEGGAGNSWGVYGISSGGVAVYAASDSGTGVNGASGSGIGVNGASSSNYGVKGTSTSASAGVYGQSSGVSAAGVWGVADADAGSAGVYGTSNNGVGVWGRNRSATGFAQRADGNALQERAYGGWAKAMALIKDDGTIGLCYNSQTSGAAISTPPCGFSTSHPATGNYVVDFGFQVSDRFISLTPRCFTSAGSCPVDVTAVVTGIANANQSRSYFRSLGGGGAIDTGFFIFVY